MRFDLRPTPAARPTADAVRGDGLVAAAAVPISDGRGQLLGVLFGGNLLNRRQELIDAVQDQVFAAKAARDGTVGTVTFFLGDLRIATNVPGSDGRPALGTRLSSEVFATVLERGETWPAPAFVSHDWYIAGYEPFATPSSGSWEPCTWGCCGRPFCIARTQSPASCW